MVEHWSPKPGVGSSSLSFRAKNSYEMNAVKDYIKESYNELVNNVSWPSNKEVISQAIVVLFASLLLALVIFGVDKCFEKLMKVVYTLLS